MLQLRAGSVSHPFKFDARVTVDSARTYVRNVDRYWLSEGPSAGCTYILSAAACGSCLWGRGGRVGFRAGWLGELLYTQTVVSTHPQATQMVLKTEHQSHIIPFEMPSLALSVRPCGLRRASHGVAPCPRRPLLCVARAQPSNGLDAPLRSQVGHPRVDLDACACGCVPDIRSNGSGFEAPVQG
jgi:hypothetical protein